jgi:hypothetical protein
MKRFLRALGVSVQTYMAWTGGQPLNAFAKANPGWSQAAWEILVLENFNGLGIEAEVKGGEDDATTIPME